MEHCVKNKLTKILKVLLACIPRPLPVGRTAMDVFATTTLETFGLPSTTSYKAALYQMILSTKSYLISPVYLAIEMKKAETKQTAFMLDREIRQQQKAAEQTNTANAVKQQEQANAPKETSQAV